MGQRNHHPGKGGKGAGREQQQQQEEEGAALCMVRYCVQCVERLWQSWSGAGPILRSRIAVT